MRGRRGGGARGIGVRPRGGEKWERRADVQWVGVGHAVFGVWRLHGGGRSAIIKDMAGGDDPHGRRTLVPADFGARCVHMGATWCVRTWHGGGWCAAISACVDGGSAGAAAAGGVGGSGVVGRSISARAVVGRGRHGVPGAGEACTCGRMMGRTLQPRVRGNVSVDGGGDDRKNSREVAEQQIRSRRGGAGRCRRRRFDVWQRRHCFSYREC